jgi:ABC-type multidrug transport system permease subunit
MSSPKMELLKVHFRSFWREPEVIFWAVLFPIIMAWILGIAFSGKPEIRKTVYVVGQVPQDTITERIFKVGGLDSPIYIDFKQSTEQEALLAMKRGEINLYLETRHGRFLYHYDPVNPDAVNTHLLVERLLSPNPVTAEIVPVTTTGNRYIDFLIPGLIALGIMNSCLWGISYNLIEFRMKKLLRRMLATPMKKGDFLLSHFLFRVTICSIETILLLLFAILFFKVQIQGSWLAFIILFISGVVCFSGIAILIASKTQNTQVGNGLINAVILPMTILSGIFFSYHNFPDWAQYFIHYLPLTVLADHIRAVFNEGAGMESLFLPTGILCGTGIACYAIGIRIFKWY